MSRETVILITLVTYKVVLLAIAVVAERRTKDGTDFFLGGRRLGPMVAAVSASASSSSAWTLLGVSGAAYAWGVSALWLFPACVGGFVLNWKVLAPALQRYGHAHRAVTVTDVLCEQAGARRSRAVAALAAVIVLVSLGVYVASQYQAAGKTFHETFGLSLEGSIWIGAGVVLIYTLVGGFWAVSLTDTLQGLVMALTAVVLPLAALVAVGGPAELVAEMGRVDTEGYLSLGGPRGPVLAVGFVLGLLGIGLGYPGQPHVVNRFMALRQIEGSMRKARRIAIAWAVVVYAGMLLLGLCGRVLFDALGDQESVFIRATNDLFHPVLAGVMLAAVLSAIMSTADSQLLVAASAVTHDLRLGGTSQKSMLRRSRMAVAGLGLIAIAVAILAPKDIFSNVLFGWAAMGAAFGPLLLVMVVLGRQMDGRAILAVMASGFGLSAVTYVALKAAGSPLYLLLGGVVPFAIAFGMALGTSRRAPGR